MRFHVVILGFGFLFPGVKLSGAPPAFSHSKSYLCQIEAERGENFDYAIAELWVPKNREVSTVLCVVMHPRDQGASRLADPAPWIELAKRTNSALVTIAFAQSPNPDVDWSLAQKGTGRAFFSALEALSLASGFSSLTTEPVVVAGVCGGGQWGYSLSAFNHSRVKAFVTIGGGKHDVSQAGFAAGVQALLVDTPDRWQEAVENVRLLEKASQKYGGTWSRSSEEIAKYDAGLCRFPFIPFWRNH